MSAFDQSGRHRLIGQADNQGKAGTFGRTEVRHPANTIEDVEKVLLGYRDNMRVEIGSDVPGKRENRGKSSRTPHLARRLGLGHSVDLDP
jgi:hypothetical protein